MLKGRDILIYLAIKYNGDWNKIYEAIRNKELVNEPEVHDTIANIPQDLKTCAIIDETYPDSMKHMYKPPFVFFYKGDINTVSRRLVAVAGNNKFKNELQDNFLEKLHTITASLTFDGYGQTATPDVAVYDRSIKNAIPGKRDVIISEFYDDNNLPSDAQFWATRLLSGISKVILLTDAIIEKNSVIPILIGYSLYLNKTVLVIKNGKNISKQMNDLEKVSDPSVVKPMVYQEDSFSERDIDKLPTELH